MKTNGKQVDCRNHVLTVFDGAVRVGSLVARGAEYLAYGLRRQSRRHSFRSAFRRAGATARQGRGGVMYHPPRKNERMGISSKNTPLKPGNAQGFVWDDYTLRRRGRALISIERDATCPQMWRVRLPTGRITDMLNLARAKDYACATALKVFDLEVLP